MLVNYSVDIIDKYGVEHKFYNTVLSLKIDRNVDMQTASCNFVVANTNIKGLIDFTGIKGIISNGNTVKSYINGVVQFTGIIRSFQIDDDNQSINVMCNDLMCLLLRPIDGGIPFHFFSKMKATNFIALIAHKAGISNVKFKIDMSKDYIIKNLKVKYDTQMSDLIDECLDTLEARSRMDKDGTLLIENMYPSYRGSDVANNINYNWHYTDFVRIGGLTRKRGSETLYNRVLVRYSDTVYDVFEEPYMIKYLGFINFKEIESPLSNTLDKRHRVANKFFLKCWRENSKVDIVATKGNHQLDLGQIIRISIYGSRIGHYMVTGINSSIEKDGIYVDQIALDGCREILNIAEKLSGNYMIKEGD